MGRQDYNGIVPAPLGRDWAYRPRLADVWYGRDLPFVSYDAATGEGVIDAHLAAAQGVSVWTEGEGSSLTIVVEKP